MDKEVKKRMAFYIRMIRLMRGLTQQDVADKLKKTTNAVSNWELGNTSPPIDDLVKLCKMFECTPNQICGWDDFPELTDYISKTESAGEILVELKKQRSLLDDQIKQYKELMNRKH